MALKYIYIFVTILNFQYSLNDLNFHDQVLRVSIHPIKTQDPLLRINQDKVKGNDHNDKYFLQNNKN